MARLPIPGSDDGEWGSILNDFLMQAHTGQGGIKPGTVDKASLSAEVQDKLDTVAGQQGATGPAGQTGATGPSGLQGNTGPSGATGATGVANVASVTVSTGSEARPSVATVFWVGGSVQPTNMATGDVWFSQDPPADIQPPTVPANLASSNLTSNSFTLTWNASSDNVGVTAYEILIDNVSYSIITGTSVNVTGRSGNATYVCKVRARDGAGNWGDYSDDLEVTTLTSSQTDHSVFGSATYAGLLKYTDSDNITVATAFYTGAPSWNVKAARLYVPSGISMPGTCTVYLFTATTDVPPNLAVPTQTATMTVIAGQWNEAEFPGTTTVAQGEVFWIGYRFSDTSYLSTNSAGATSVQATDGSALYMSGNSTPSGILYRNYYRVGTSSTSSSAIGGQGYGIDVIVSEI